VYGVEQLEKGRHALNPTLKRMIEKSGQYLEKIVWLVPTAGVELY
jgi:hypothetical protein